jgi:predicted secreted protein
VDELVAACFRFNDPAETVTLGSGETERWALTVVNTGSTKAGGSPTVTMQRLWDASSQFPALVAVSIKPAAAVSDNRRVIVIQ